MKIHKMRVYALLSALCWLAAVAVIVLDKWEVLVLPKTLGGLLAGGGAGLGSLLAVNAVIARYYSKHEKAQKDFEVGERDERNQAIRGKAAYRALVSATPIFITEWVILLVMDLPPAVLMLVCAGYLAHFGVYLYHVVKLQKEM